MAPDLRGHGRSPRGAYTVAEWIEDLVESVPAEPDLAIGHSLGGVLLAESVSRLRPAKAVYEDPGWWIAPDREPMIAEFVDRKRHSESDVRRMHPRWSADVVRQRMEGFARWDDATARAFLGEVRDYTPAGRPRQPSLVVLAAGSPFVSRDSATRLRSDGWQVRTVPGTGHHVHLDDRPAFLKAVVDWSSSVR